MPLLNLTYVAPTTKQKNEKNIVTVLMDFPSAHSKDYSPYPIVLLCMDYAIVFLEIKGFMKIGRKSVSPCKCFFGYVVTLLFCALKFAVFRNLVREIWFKKSG